MSEYHLPYIDGMFVKIYAQGFRVDYDETSQKWITYTHPRLPRKIIVYLQVI